MPINSFSIYRFGAPIIIIGAIICTISASTAYNLIGFPNVFGLAEPYIGDAEVTENNASKIMLAQKAIKVAPHRAQNYVALSKYYISEDNGFSKRALDTLRTSYKIAPFSSYASEDRIELIFRNWNKIPPDLKQLAQDEASHFATRIYGTKFLKRILLTLPSDASFSAAIAIQRGQILRKHYDK